MKKHVETRVIPFAAGVFPDSWLPARSGQHNLDRFPMARGIGPPNPFEFKDLQFVGYEFMYHTTQRKEI